MKALAGGLLLSLVPSALLHAQERDRSLERIALALQQLHPVAHTISLVESTAPKTFGIFTLVAPERPGEIVRVSVPIGALVTRAFRRVSAAKQQRQEEAARRRVEEELKRFADRPPSSKR